MWTPKEGLPKLTIDVDLILGHHAHVVRAFRGEVTADWLCGLGNYTMRGARNMGPLPDPQDYGLLVTILKENLLMVVFTQNRLVAPAYEMHWNSRSWVPRTRSVV